MPTAHDRSCRSIEATRRLPVALTSSTPVINVAMEAASATSSGDSALELSTRIRSNPPVSRSTGRNTYSGPRAAQTLPETRRIDCRSPDCAIVGIIAAPSATAARVSWVLPVRQAIDPRMMTTATVTIDVRQTAIVAACVSARSRLAPPAPVIELPKRITVESQPNRPKIAAPLTIAMTKL